MSTDEKFAQYDEISLPWCFLGGFICANMVYFNPIYTTEGNYSVRLVCAEMQKILLTVWGFFI